MSKPGIVKNNVLQKIIKFGLIIVGVIIAAAGLLSLPVNDVNLYASHPNPLTDYGEAVRRIEGKIASEKDFYEGSHTFLLTHGAKTEKVIVFAHGFGSSAAPFKEIASEFYNRGYNVLVMTIPGYGLADRMNTAQANLRAEDFIRYGDDVVDIAHGLGEHVTMAGISGGGLVTAWVAQLRKDVDLAVLISPGLGAKAIPRFWTPLMSRFFQLAPNWYVWEDPVKKENAPRPYNYVRIPSKVVGQILRMGIAVKSMAQQEAPAAGSIVVITNLNEPGIDNVAVDTVAELWRTNRPKDVETYQFPAELGLGHDIIDVTDPQMNVAVVYPKLLELIDR